MSSSYPTKLLLAFKSGNRCAFPDCDRSLTVDSVSGLGPAVFGVAAHIAGENPDAARFNPQMTPQERDHYNNLIYLCPNHHERIDKQEQDFPVMKLQGMKYEHELKVHKAMLEAFSSIGFPELEIATRWIIHIAPSMPTQDYSVVSPENKIGKNQLTDPSRSIIKIGLSVSKEVRNYLESVAKTDVDFPERLKIGFLNEYYRLKGDGYKGDSLFSLMCQFAQHGLEEVCHKLAGVAILVYLFEACEVFEK